MENKQRIQSIIRIIIFSKDRPMQLDALLRSLKYHCKDLQIAAVNVLFHSKNKLFLQQYARLEKFYKDIVFQKQYHFQSDLINIIKSQMTGRYDQFWKIYPYIPKVLRHRFTRQIQVPENAYILFLVDDTIFIRYFSLEDILLCFQKIPDLLGFSLRLGENTQYCYPMNKPQPLPKFHELNHLFYYYRWVGEAYDFGYPLEVSSSFYRLRDITPLLLSLSYRNPNTLEAALAANAFRYADTHPFLACYKTSVAFSVPMNRVQSDMKNRFGENYSYDVYELGNRFDRGETIDIEQLSGIIPNACHQEVELKFTKRSV